MLRAEPTNHHTAGIGLNYSNMFTLLLELNVIYEEKWIQFELQNSPSRVFAFDGKIEHELPLIAMSAAHTDNIKTITKETLCDNYADRIYVVIAITLVASALITCIPVYRVRCRWSALV